MRLGPALALALAAASAATVAAASLAAAPACIASGPRQECGEREAGGARPARPRPSALSPTSFLSLLGYPGIPQKECRQECCFDTPPPLDGDADQQQPACFHANGGESTYRVEGGTSDLPARGKLVQVRGGNESFFFFFFVRLFSTPLIPLQTASTLPTFGPDISTLDYEISRPAPDAVRVRVSAPGRWELPPSAVPGASGLARDAGGDSSPPSLDVEFEAAPFGVAVSRRGANGQPSDSLFDSRGTRLVFKDMYLELTTAVNASASLYGLGERTRSSPTLPIPRDGRPLALWARDGAAADADTNTYGAWPIVWRVDEGGGVSAMILLSSNGMDVVLTPTTLTWRVTGGVIDLIIVGGDGTPGSVAERVAAVVGRPTLVPYWAFGLMNSKYGYASAAQTERVLDSFEAAGVPVRTEGRQFLCCALAAADSHLFPPLL